MLDLKEQCVVELINGIMPYIDERQMQDVKMRIYMVLGKYDVQKSETAVTVYEGDVNEVMLKRFLMAKLARGLSRRTIQFYRVSLKRILDCIGKPYNEVTPDDVRLFLAMRVQRDRVSKTTANNDRRNLSAFYTWLQNEEILLANPMRKVEGLKETKKKKKAFTQMDLELIRNACETSMETALVEVLISTWARVSEVAQIKIADLKGDRCIVHGKGDKEREVFFTPKAQLAVNNYLADRKDNNPYLFPRTKYEGDMRAFQKTIGQLGVGRAGQKTWYKYPECIADDDHRDVSVIEYTIRKIGKRAGVENVHPHRFRRTGATMALRSGMPLITVSKLLGHENIGTTQIYLDISDKELADAHERYVS